MRRITFIIIIFLLVTLSGCDKVALFGGGVAASETFQAWQDNLEAKKAELQTQYDQVLLELESAPDPNAVQAAKEKLSLIRQQQLVNEGAIMGIQAALEIPQAQGEDRTDAIAVAGVGFAGLVYEWLTKRKLNLKYVAHKQGQAAFTKEDPAAGSKLYATIGAERARLKV